MYAGTLLGLRLSASLDGIPKKKKTALVLPPTFSGSLNARINWKTQCQKVIYCGETLYEPPHNDNRTIVVVAQKRRKSRRRDIEY